MNKFAVLYVGCLAVFCAQTAVASSCRFSALRTAAIDGGPFHQVVISAGAGDLRVRGDKSLTTPRASGKACASSQELLDKMQIEVRSEGDTLYIKAEFPEADRGGFFDNDSVSLDLSVDVPETMPADVVDSSGDANISGTGSTSVTDSSGDLSISNIYGDLSVIDSSGSIDIQSVAGNMQLRDSSGDVDVADVTGNLDIPVDSSGDLRLRRIGGHLQIGTDSSGDIVIQQVQRNVTIDRDSSGDINVDEVGGDLAVRADASGDIAHSRIQGKTDLPAGRH